MIIRHPLTALTLAALLMAGGAALAGGMPSDEGPEVILDELGYDELGIDGGDSLDDDTITAIIKNLAPLPEAYVPEAYVPAAYVTTVAVIEAPQTAPASTPELAPAQLSPEDEWRRDHR